jgi:hypothetical protein
MRNYFGALTAKKAAFKGHFEILFAKTMTVLPVALVAATAAAGCVYTTAPTYVPPTPARFDPTGTWDGYNENYVGISTDYLSFTDSFGVTYTPLTTGGYFDATLTQASAETFFGPAYAPPAGTAAVYSVPSVVRVQYNSASNTAYVNLTGEPGTVYTNPGAYIALPATDAGVTLQIDPANGGVYEASFLNSTGCYYHYVVYLTLGFNGSNSLDGFITSRFDFVNDYAGWNLSNPTCDEIFAAFQDDFDFGYESYFRNGLLFDLVYNTTDYTGYFSQPAVDYRYIFAIGGFQFDSAFFAQRYTRGVALRDPSFVEAPTELSMNGDFIHSRMVNPEAISSFFIKQGNQERFTAALERVRARGVTHNGRRVDGSVSFPNRSSQNGVVTPALTAEERMAIVLSTRGAAGAQLPNDR